MSLIDRMGIPALMQWLTPRLTRHAGRAGVGVALFTEENRFQLIHFIPSTATTAFQAEAEAVCLALRDWHSPFLQKSKIIYTDCLSLVNFLETGDTDVIPCWQGDPMAHQCLQKIRLGRERGEALVVSYSPRERNWLTHELANVARAGISFIGCPT
jgi:Reverse transcriptase-like